MQIALRHEPQSGHDGGMRHADLYRRSLQDPENFWLGHLRQPTRRQALAVKAGSPTVPMPGWDVPARRDRSAGRARPSRGSAPPRPAARGRPPAPTCRRLKILPTKYRTGRRSCSRHRGRREKWILSANPASWPPITARVASPVTDTNGGSARGRRHTGEPSYFQFDQQGVVFNMWYFGWFDEAMARFLGEAGYPYLTMMADGLDVQLAAYRGGLARGRALRGIGDGRRGHRARRGDQFHAVLHRAGRRVSCAPPPARFTWLWPRTARASSPCRRSSARPWSPPAENSPAADPAPPRTCTS